MARKGVTQQQLADAFGVLQPSVSYWVRTGRVEKGKLNRLFHYFVDVAGPEHWGITAFAIPSVDILDLSRRLDALRQTDSFPEALARVSQVLDDLERRFKR